MAVYVTGDTHGGIDMHKLSRRELKRSGITLAEDDFLLILGDFGFPFLDSEPLTPRGEYHYWMKWFRERRYTVLWIDGNHDNFSFWKKQPITERFGGRVQVHPDAPNVLHLLRGEIYEIEGKSFFAFGGAASHDKKYRTPGKDWWAGEEASEEDITNAEKNLAARNFRVDYILTHTPPRSVAGMIPMFSPVSDKTADFLSEVMARTEYRVWLCGHIHMDFLVRTARLAVFYQSAASIEEIEKELASSPFDGE